MKRNFAAGILISMVLVTLGLSCDLSEGATGNSGTSGTVRVSIKSRMLESLNRDLTIRSLSTRSLGPAGSRAMAFYDRWVTWIVNADGIKVDTETVTIDGVSATLSAPEGTGYTVHLEIYNSAMSEIVPMAAGSVSNVTITAGVTSQARIVCLPLNTITLESGVQSPEVIYEPFLETAGGGIGTETWYKLGVADGENHILISTDFDSGTVPVWALFDSSGYMFSSSLGELLESPSEIGINVVPGADYYLAILNYAGITGNASVLFDYDDSPPGDDQYEPNGTTRTATALDGTDGSLTGCILNPYDTDFYKLETAQANLKLHILVFSGDSVDFFVVDSAGTDLASGIENVELIVNLPAIGTYYIEIPGYTVASYDLTWSLVP